MSGRRMVWLVALAATGVLTASCGGDSIVGDGGEEPPSVSLNVQSADFVAAAGEGAQGQAVAITNGGQGALTGLSRTIEFGSGEPAGWLTATLSGSAAPATLLLEASAASLAAGVYGATIGVSAAVAPFGPQLVAVTFTVTAPPSIALSSTTAHFEAGDDPAGLDAHVIDVTNGGTGGLAGLDVTIVYAETGGKLPPDWLVASLSQVVAPATLTLEFDGGDFPAGLHEATVTVSASGEAVTPQDIAVTLDVKKAGGYNLKENHKAERMVAPELRLRSP